MPLVRQAEDTLPALPATSGQTPNGGSKHFDTISLGAFQERLPDSPVVLKRTAHHVLEKSASLNEINSATSGQWPSDSSRSHSPSSTEPDTPSPISESKHNSKGTRIPHLASKKSPGEEDSASTGEETDSSQGKKKFPLKIFKKPKK